MISDKFEFVWVHVWKFFYKSWCPLSAKKNERWCSPQQICWRFQLWNLTRKLIGLFLVKVDFRPESHAPGNKDLQGTQGSATSFTRHEVTSSREKKVVGGGKKKLPFKQQPALRILKTPIAYCRKWAKGLIRSSWYYQWCSCFLFIFQVDIGFEYEEFPRYSERLASSSVGVVKPCGNTTLPVEYQGNQ